MYKLYWNSTSYKPSKVAFYYKHINNDNNII